MYIQALASGSKGNSYLVGSDRTAFLVDQGLSALQLTRRLQDAGMSPGELQAIFVTHEHGDHIRGIRVLAARHDIPVYASQPLMSVLKEKGALEGVKRLRVFEKGDTVQMGDLELQPFSVSHDAVDPVNYLVRHGDLQASIVTDLGFVSHLVREKVRACRWLYLESNHDLKMLRQGPYPLDLQRRIRGRQGHLSNEQALDLLEELLPGEMLQGVSFIHLSEENNDPSLLRDELQSRLETMGKNINFEICTQHSIAERRKIS